MSPLPILTFLRKEITEARVLEDKHTKSGSLDSASDICHSFKTQTPRLAASNVPPSQTENHLSADRGSHTAEIQACNCEAYNVQLSLQVDGMMHERAYDEMLLFELALGSQRWELFKLDMKYLNHNKEVMYR